MFYARKWQEYVASRMLKAFKPYSNDQIFMVTIADRQRVTLADFKDFDLRKFKSRLRKLLERQREQRGAVVRWGDAVEVLKQELDLLAVRKWYQHLREITARLACNAGSVTKRVTGSYCNMALSRDR